MSLALLAHVPIAALLLSAGHCHQEIAMQYIVSWMLPQGTFNATISRFLET